MTNPGNASVFEMAGAGGDDPLGLWTASPAESAVHFGVGDEVSAPPPDVPVYRARLPEDPAAGELALSAQDERLRLSSRALDSVPGRLDAFIERQQAAAAPRMEGGEVHFGVGEPPLETGPEADLLGLLGEAEAAEVTLSTDLVHFGIVEEVLSPALQEAQEKFNALMEQINREVLHFAWVETEAGQATLARSTVNWSGDTVTVWVDDIPPEQVDLHNRTLHFAVASRALKMRMGFVIASGASKLAILLTTPGAQALALPVAYKFVTQVLAQVREYQALSAA
jgi:hypothetical protein